MTYDVKDIGLERNVARLCRLRNAPKERDAKRAAGEDLRRYCSSLEHIEATVEAIIEGFEYFPTTQEIKAAAASVRVDQKEHRKSREACRECSGTGYVMRWYLVTNKSSEATGRRMTKALLTNEQAADLGKKVGYQVDRQYVTEAAVRCVCMPPMPEAKANGGYR